MMQKALTVTNVLTYQQSWLSTILIGEYSTRQFARQTCFTHVKPSPAVNSVMLFEFLKCRQSLHSSLN